MVTGYLAKAIFDDHKRVAVVFGNRGSGGGNAAGNEQSAAMGAEREIEARQALATLSVSHVWFLSGLDTPSQNVLNSLETWNHGDSLGQLVRLVRLTRPEIILTWLPGFVAGENHGDHQAAGVLATEAFDLAADPASFPEQIAAPRDRNGLSNLTEGLRPWQTKKIYYFTDAARPEFQEGHGPTYSTEGKSKAKGVEFYRLAAEEMRSHLTQGDTGQMAEEAIAKGDFAYFRQPVRLIFGKSLVGGSTKGDIFEGIENRNVAFAPPARVASTAPTDYSIELGGPWYFYREFYSAHALTHLDDVVPSNEIQVGPGRELPVRIVLRNNTEKQTEMTVALAAPVPWNIRHHEVRCLVRAQDVCALTFIMLIPENSPASASEVRFKASANGKEVGTIALRVFVTPGAMPQ
jgi:LmbE family N-acetylglucosaminyl deacetylase